MKDNFFYRQTWVEIDLKCLAANFFMLKKSLPSSTKIMAAVKANAYGHGIIEVARKLVDCGVDYLGVACVDEALFLRKNLIDTPILNLGAFLKSDMEAMVKHDICATVSDLSLAKKLDDCASRLKKKAKVHVKIDTGMGRLGIWHEDAFEFIVKLCALENIVIEGLYTHFPSADSDEAFTRSQINTFCTLIDKLTIKGVEIPLKHSANSVAIMGYQDSHFNLVRPGLAIYGLYPQEEFCGPLTLLPVLSFKTKVAFVKKVSKGMSISYGRTHIVGKNTKIATLPVGYGDGYNRLLSNKGKVLIRGKICPVVGIVCMDQMMADVGHIGSIKIEDEVVLIGSQGSHSIRVENIAQACRTIPYEVVCWISPRVPRVYLNA
ncbi:MAG: alanine racemase [Candidatus Omnitrophota bacterium]